MCPKLYLNSGIYGPKDGLELLTSQPPPPEFWDYRRATVPDLCDTGDELRALHVVGKNLPTGPHRRLQDH